MFNYLKIESHEDRKIDNFTEGKLSIDTCAIPDSDQPYETGIKHPLYNKGKWITVELYDTPEEAQKGHDKWVAAMTAEDLPRQLIDVSTAGTAMALDSDPNWRIFPRCEI